MRNRPRSVTGKSGGPNQSCYSWTPDLADHRDFSPRHRRTASLLAKLPSATAGEPPLPTKIDWRDRCPPVEREAGRTTSSTHACLALVEMLERCTSGRELALSRPFVEYNARRYAAGRRECGLALRTVLKVIRRCGAPSEEYYPYDDAAVEGHPDAFAYSFQRSFRALRYLRLDDGQASGDVVLGRVRSFLAAGFPVTFGFSLHRSLADDGEIWFPKKRDSVVGGQAVVAVGYHDHVHLGSDRGALLVRNSWGHEWGDGGYGWLSYAYVTRRLATDYWTLIKRSWLRSGGLERPRPLT